MKVSEAPGGTEQFSYTRRFCKWFRKEQRERGLIDMHISESIFNGFWINVFMVEELECIADGTSKQKYSTDKLIEIERKMKMVYLDQLVVQLTDYGINPSCFPPEASGEPHPQMVALLNGEI